MALVLLGLRLRFPTTPEVAAADMSRRGLFSSPFCHLLWGLRGHSSTLLSHSLPCDFEVLSTKEAACISPSFTLGWLYDSTCLIK